MKITEEVRAYARSHGVEEDHALQEGMKQKAAEFREAGAQLYSEA